MKSHTSMVISQYYLYMAFICDWNSFPKHRDGRFGASPCSGPGTGHLRRRVKRSSKKSQTLRLFAQQTFTGRRTAAWNEPIVTAPFFWPLWTTPDFAIQLKFHHNQHRTRCHPCYHHLALHARSCASSADVSSPLAAFLWLLNPAVLRRNSDTNNSFYCWALWRQAHSRQDWAKTNGV